MQMVGTAPPTPPLVFSGEKTFEKVGKCTSYAIGGSRLFAESVHSPMDIRFLMWCYPITPATMETMYCYLSGDYVLM
jgi:hypothetical protein